MLSLRLPHRKMFFKKKGQLKLIPSVFQYALGKNAWLANSLSHWNPYQASCYHSPPLNCGILTDKYLSNIRVYTTLCHLASFLLFCWSICSVRMHQSVAGIKFELDTRQRLFWEKILSLFHYYFCRGVTDFLKAYHEPWGAYVKINGLVHVFLFCTEVFRTAIKQQRSGSYSYICTWKKPTCTLPQTTFLLDFAIQNPTIQCHWREIHANTVYTYKEISLQKGSQIVPSAII